MFTELQKLNQRIEEALDDPSVSFIQYSGLVTQYMELISSLEDDEIVTYLSL